MFPVRESIRQILSELPEGVKLVAVSKFHPNEYIEAAYQEGQRVFGESREQELAKKVVKEQIDKLIWNNQRKISIPNI